VHPKDGIMSLSDQNKKTLNRGTLPSKWGALFFLMMIFPFNIFNQAELTGKRFRELTTTIIKGHQNGRTIIYYSKPNKRHIT
jgi:hypothetical protein